MQAHPRRWDGIFNVAAEGFVQLLGSNKDVWVEFVLRFLKGSPCMQENAFVVGANKIELGKLFWTTMKWYQQ